MLLEYHNYTEHAHIVINVARVRPHNWTLGSSMDDMRFCCFHVSQLGWEKLKELQLNVVTAFVAGQDVFAVLPTGYGKSLCFACLQLLFDHLYQLEDSQGSIVIVVTPLTAIIRPGKSSLVSLFFYGIKVPTIKSTFVALGSPTESEHRLLLLLGGIISTAYTVHCGILQESLGSYIN